MSQSRFKLVTLLVLLTVLMSLLPMSALAQEPQKLILATTTSTADSGLLDNILPNFEKEFNAKVEVVAVGTGQAIKLGEDGNADVLLVHARAQEDKFVADGFGVDRKDVMYNDFIIVGPASDPAGIKGMTSATDAFKKIADAKAPFISRGDNSGTDIKEKDIWAAAGIEPQGEWYVEAGQGMGAVLTMANEQNAYTLSDRGTYLARTLEGTDLQVLVEGDPILFNPYGVIAVNPEKHPTANYDLAMKFINWLTSVPTQQMILDFKHPSGQSLFTPDSEEWMAVAPQKLILATTTSTADSGLLDVILPDFEKEFNAKVEVVAVGTGQAIKLGEDGNADVLLVHARAQEDKFVADGFGVNREDVMYNDFIILGPVSDPAGIKGMTSATEAFKKIADAKAPFVSRGDNSGTHTKEKEIWAAAGIEPQGEWYIEAGQGMGAVLTMANEQNAYTLSDRGTYLARTLEGTDLQVLVEGDPVLFNPYGVIAVNPEKYDTVKYDLAMTFINWLTSVPTQQKILDFKHPSGQSLFTPDSEEWMAAQAETPAAPAQQSHDPIYPEPPVVAPVARSAVTIVSKPANGRADGRPVDQGPFHARGKTPGRHVLVPVSAQSRPDEVNGAPRSPRDLLRATFTAAPEQDMSVGARHPTQSSDASTLGDRLHILFDSPVRRATDARIQTCRGNAPHPLVVTRDSFQTACPLSHEEKEMKRVGFLLKVKQDRLEEYKKHHQAVWPDMLDALRRTGWHNYSLFLRDDGLLFGYFETPVDFQAALDGMAAEEVNVRWNEFMKPYFEALGDTNPDEAMLELAEVFHLD